MMDQHWSSTEMFMEIVVEESKITWDDVWSSLGASRWLGVPERIRRMTVPNIEPVQRIWQSRMVYPMFTGHSFSIGGSKK